MRRAAPALALLLLLVSGGCAFLAPTSMPDSPDLAGLPLLEIPAARPAPGRPLAVVLSGDGGWSGRVQEISEELARRGVSAVGWNSLRYYWRARTPEEAAGDLARILAHYRRAWRAGPVLLVGYSFGADVLPHLANRLPAALRAEVAEVALVGFSAGASFHFHFANWFGRQVGRTYPNHPEVEALQASGVPVLCVNGKREELRGCDGLPPRGLRVVYLPTGHRFQGYYDEIADLMVRQMGSGAAPAPTARD